MNRSCSIFSQLLKVFPRLEFQQAVRQHKAEYHARGFPSRSQFIAMLFAPVAAQRSHLTVEAVATRTRLVPNFQLVVGTAELPQQPFDGQWRILDRAPDTGGAGRFSQCRGDGLLSHVPSDILGRLLYDLYLLDDLFLLDAALRIGWCLRLA